MVLDIAKEFVANAAAMLFMAILGYIFFSLSRYFSKARRKTRERQLELIKSFSVIHDLQADPEKVLAVLIEANKRAWLETLAAVAYVMMILIFSMWVIVVLLELEIVKIW